MSQPESESLAQPVRESFKVLGLYVRGQVLLCLILTVLYSATFWAVHVPYGIIIGIVGGCAAIIPRIGGLVPLGLAVLALDLSETSWKRILLVLGLWVLIQAISFFVLMPRLVHRPLGLKEWPVVIALLLGSLLFGPLGLLLAVPVLAIGLVFWRYFRRSRTPSVTSKPRKQKKN